MSLAEKKDECNLKYAQVLELLKNRGDLNQIHLLLIEVVEGLLAIGNIDYKEKETCNIKSISLMKIIKSIYSDSLHSDIYFQLTGEKLPLENHEFEDVFKGLEELENKTETDYPDEKDVNEPNFGINDTGNSKNNRPKYLNDFVGQERIKTQIKESIEAAKIKNQPLEHILLFGSAGLGKTSLSKIVANEMNSRIIIMSGPTIKNAMSLVSVIKDVKYGDIVFIDEIHSINPTAAEVIYTVMEDFELSYVEKNRDGDKNITIHLPHFTFIGATTHSGLLEKPMRDRFSLQFKLDLYSLQDLTQIATALVESFGTTIDEDAAISIAKRSRGVPRILNSFVNRLYDRALVKGLDKIDLTSVEEYFSANGIDENGLNDVDIEYLKALYDKSGVKPLGIDNIASRLGEGKDIIESQIEPHLIYLGLIQITPSGRLLTSDGVNLIENK